VDSNTNILKIDHKVQLVCKYLFALLAGVDQHKVEVIHYFFSPNIQAKDAVSKFDDVYKKILNGKKLIDVQVPPRQVRLSKDFTGISISKMLKNLSDLECKAILKSFVPEYQNSIVQLKMFVDLMYRRCCFLETCPNFTYNEGQLKMDFGSEWMNLMLEEVKSLMDKIISPIGMSIISASSSMKMEVMEPSN